MKINPPGVCGSLDVVEETVEANHRTVHGQAGAEQKCHHKEDCPPHDRVNLTQNVNYFVSIENVSSYLSRLLFLGTVCHVSSVWSAQLED